MANSRGGIIIIGIDEDAEASDGTPKSIVGFSDGDQEANWIQSICQSCIDAPIPGLKIRDIPLGNDKDCVIINIPDSPRKPHMVVHENHRSFRIRHGRANAIIGMEEIRQMILSMDSYQSNLQKFVFERIEANQAKVNPNPFLLFMSTPLYVNFDRIDPLEKQYCDLLKNIPESSDPMYEGIAIPGRPKPRIFGIETTTHQQGSDAKPKKILRLFRNGHFEYFEDYSQFLYDGSIEIDAYRIAVLFLHFLNVAKQIYAIPNQTSPLAISLILGNIFSSTLSLKPRYSYSTDKYIWTEPLLHIDLSVNTLDDPNQIAVYLLDRLHNAYGYEKNILFDEENDLVLI
jgi:hypothetical protein